MECRPCALCLFLQAEPFDCWRVYGLTLSVSEDLGKDDHTVSPALCQAVSAKLSAQSQVWPLPSTQAVMLRQHIICMEGQSMQPLHVMWGAYMLLQQQHAAAEAPTAVGHRSC